MTPKNKKAQLFTILAIVLLGLMFLSFELFSVLHERKVIQARVSTMDSFLKAIEDNLQKQVYIAGYRILFLADNYIVEEGAYLGMDDYYADSDPVHQFFEEALLEGTIAGVEENILLKYSDISEKIQEKADRTNTEVTIENPPAIIIVKQDDPWNVNLTIVFNLTFKDKEDLAKWEKTESVSALIPVTSFSDPIFNVETYNKVPRLIARTIYENFSSDPTNNDLIGNIDNEYYSANADAPSFLKRLVGDFSADANGIESFVILPDLSQQGLSVDISESCIDHKYFDEYNDFGNQIAGVHESWFKVDNGHLSKYTM
jgi:hypothetical protein